MTYQTTVRFDSDKPEQAELAEHIKHVAANTDYAKTEYIRDLIRADMEAVEQGHDPVDGLRNGLDELSTIEPWEQYDPDDEREEPLPKEMLRTITETTLQRLNPDHVDESEVPNGAAIKTEIVLSVLRYWKSQDEVITYRPREDRKNGSLSRIGDHVDKAIKQTIGATRHHLDSGGSYADIPGRVADQLVPDDRVTDGDGCEVLPADLNTEWHANTAEIKIGLVLDDIDKINNAESVKGAHEDIKHCVAEIDWLEEAVEESGGELVHPDPDNGFSVDMDAIADLSAKKKDAVAELSMRNE